MKYDTSGTTETTSNEVVFLFYGSGSRVCSTRGFSDKLIYSISQNTHLSKHFDENLCIEKSLHRDFPTPSLSTSVNLNFPFRRHYLKELFAELVLFYSFENKH